MHTTQTPEMKSTASIRGSVPSQPWQLAAPPAMLRVTGMSPYRPTRREFLVGAGSLLVLAPYGCGSDRESGAGGETANGGTRTFRHFAGTTEVPNDPQRIVALQDQNALLPLLELGVTPVGSAGVPDEDGPGGSFRRVAEYEVSEVEYVGNFEEPSLEAVAAQEPDLIVGIEDQEGIYDRLSEIAPTVPIQIFGRPLTEVLDDYARLVGRQDRHTELEVEYRRAIDDLIAGLPVQPKEITLSWIGFNSDGTFDAPTGQVVGTVLSDVGFTRPEPQPASISEERVSDISFEKITAHDADVMISPDDSGELEELGQAIQEARNRPLFQKLDVVQRDEVHFYDVTPTVGSAFGKMQNFIGFLNSIFVERDPTLGDR